MLIGEPGSPPNIAVAGSVREQVVEEPAMMQRLLSSVLHNSPDGILAYRSVRRSGRIVDFECVVVNPAAEQIAGRPAHVLLGTQLRAEMPGHADTDLFDRYVDVVESGHEFEAEHVDGRDGLEQWFRTTAVKTDDGFTVTFRDVSAEKRLQRELDFKALHDDLTDLPNRALFLDRTRHALASMSRRGRSHAVLFVDIDRFKVVNDSLGHVAGDALIRELGRRISNTARSNDTVSRFSGDEFVMLCEDLADDGAAAVIAGRLLAAIAEPIELDGHELTVTASIGVSIATSASVDPGELIRDADTAMYRAKSRGGGVVEVFDDDLRQRTMDRLNLEIDLRRAIATDEIEAFYQPIIDVASDRIVAAEALVRWRHPVHGLLAPVRFLPIAEESGLIVDVGEIVLRSAVGQLAAWRDDPMIATPNYVSVNVAAAQLSMPTFARQVAAIIDQAGITASQLCLEVTETSLIRDPVTAQATLEQLAALGIRIALDDFGTGYSPLSYLRQFPVDTIKVDRSFVTNLATSTSDRAVVAAVVALGHELDKVVIAEGVEDREHLGTLTTLGADEVQGYLYSPPIPAGDFVTMLRSDAG